MAETSRSLRDDVASTLRDRIVDGTHAPGSRLVERQVASELGVSRVPVREALHALVSEGLVADSAARGLEVRRYDRAQIDELAEVGMALEAVLVRRLCAADPDAARLAPLRDALDAATEAIDHDDVDAAVAANARFHEALTDSADGRIVTEVLLGLAARRRWLLRQHTDAAAVRDEHEAVYAALLAGDADAAVALVESHARSSIGRAVTTSADLA